MSRTVTPPLLLLLMAAVVSVGCSTSLTNMTPAKAMEPLDGQAAVNVQADVHSNVVGKSIDAGDAARRQIRTAEEGEEVSEDVIRDYIDGGLAWLLFQPGVAFEFMARLGVTDDVLEGIDVGLRYNTNVVKGDAKLQLWESELERYALSFQFGYGYHLNVVDDVISYFSLTDWSRHDFDFMLSGGMELGDVFKAWIAPRVITSLISVDHQLPDFVRQHVPASLDQHDPNQLFEDETMLYYGITWGFMLGYKYAFLNVEFNTFKLAFEPTVLGQERNFNAAVFAPSGGITVMWY